MFLGRVVGCVWATAKNPQMEGLRFLVVQPLTPELCETGKRLICADAAGAGEIVYYCRGKECSFPFLPAEVPTDSTIVGIVDSIRVNRAARTEVATSALPPAAPARQVRGRNSRKS